jgi:hypothetical protein
MRRAHKVSAPRNYELIAGFYAAVAVVVVVLSMIFW